MTIAEIKKVCFVGSGTMGCYNSLVAAIAGYQVVIYDNSELSLAGVLNKHNDMAQLMVANGMVSAQDIEQALQAITLSSSLAQALSQADLVSESVFERKELKRQVHQELELLSSQHTLVTTNTSSLLVSDIEDVLQDGSRFAALHSYLGSRLMEVVGGPRTSAQSLDVLHRYVISLGATPLPLKKEYPGYVFNALLGGLFVSAQLLVIEGIASLEDVDRAWRIHSNGAIGPFALMDFIGINVAYDGWTDKHEKAHKKYLASKLVPFLQSYMDRGATGTRAGEGFYQYPDALCHQSDFLHSSTSLEPLYTSLMTAVIQRSVLVEQAGVADKHDINQTWKIGLGMEDGPFDVLKDWGERTFLLESERLQSSIRINSEKDFDSLVRYASDTKA